MKNGLKRAAQVVTIGAALSCVLQSTVIAQAAPPKHTTKVKDHLHWHACPRGSISTKLPIKCTTIKVPRDYHDPSGPKIGILISKTEAKGQSKGVILGNPGGPGGDAIDFLDRFYGDRMDGFHDNFDAIGMQPRGLRWSTPLNCGVFGINETFDIDPVVQWHPDETNIHKTAIPANLATCNVDQPGYIDTVNTENTANDINEVRKALGLKKISYLGVSYGTELGAVWATLHPETVDKIILDSNVNPDWVWNWSAYAQGAAFNTRQQDMWEWIAKNDKKYHLGNTPYKVWTNFTKANTEDSMSLYLATKAPQLQDSDIPQNLPSFIDRYQLRQKLGSDVAQRIANTVLYAGQYGGYVAATYALELLFLPLGTLAASLATEVIQLLVPPPGLASAIKAKPTKVAQQAAYTVRWWPRFTDALSKWINKGDRKPMNTLADTVSKHDPTNAWVQYGVMCNEGSNDTFKPDMFLRGTVGMLTGTDFWSYYEQSQGSGFACTLLFPGHKKPEVKVGGSRLATKPLVVQSLHDPATPYQGGPRMAELMGGHLVTVKGGDHGNVGENNPTLNKAVLKYLTNGQMPSFTTVGTSPVPEK